METVPRIFKRIRPGFRYDRSLDVLRASRAAGLVTKSNLILGMGETRAEVSEALADLSDAGAEIITITSTCGRPAASSCRPLGQAGGVRRTGGRGEVTRFRWRNERTPRTLLLSCWPAVPRGTTDPPSLSVHASAV